MKSQRTEYAKLIISWLFYPILRLPMTLKLIIDIKISYYIQYIANVFKEILQNYPSGIEKLLFHTNRWVVEALT